ncbi:unnamed protein product [Ectocarpus sp. 6 AP-2014]
MLTPEDTRSRCVRKGVEGGCTYTKRRVCTCAPYGKRASSVQAAGAAKLDARHDGSEHVVVKRYRFSASPATGLVGMQENVFLSNFFDSVSFLPLTTRSCSTDCFCRIRRRATSG